MSYPVPPPELKTFLGLSLRRGNCTFRRLTVVVEEEVGGRGITTTTTRDAAAMGSTTRPRDGTPTSADDRISTDARKAPPPKANRMARDDDAVEDRKTRRMRSPSEPPPLVGKGCSVPR